MLSLQSRCDPSKWAYCCRTRSSSQLALASLFFYDKSCFSYKSSTICIIIVLFLLFSFKTLFLSIPIISLVFCIYSVIWIVALKVFFKRYLFQLHHCRIFYVHWFSLIFIDFLWFSLILFNFHGFLIAIKNTTMKQLTQVSFEKHF